MLDSKQKITANEINPQDEASGAKQGVDSSGTISKALASSATGDDKITITSHSLSTKMDRINGKMMTGVDVGIKNVTDKIIGSALFMVTFYDIEGNALEVVEYKTLELLPGTTRNLQITTKNFGADKIKSYQLRTVKTNFIPKSTATGNNKVAILKHRLLEATDEGNIQRNFEIELAVKNISGSTVATVEFEAIFYDIDGRVASMVKHNELELGPGLSRAVIIDSRISEIDGAKGYDVKITKVITADIERVQLRKQIITTTPAGEKEISGTVKNISEVKTDATIEAIFYNLEDKSIGNEIVVLKDIEPGAINQFKIFFKPKEGDIIKSCLLRVSNPGE